MTCVLLAMTACSTRDFEAGHREKRFWEGSELSANEVKAMAGVAGMWICAYRYIQADRSVPEKDGIATLKPIKEENLVCSSFKTDAGSEQEAVAKFYKDGWWKWASDPSRPEYKALLAFGPRCRPFVDVN